MNMRKMKDLISLSIGYGSDDYLKASQLEYVFENYFTYLSIKTHVVGTQKKVSNEMVLLRTRNACLNQ